MRIWVIVLLLVRASLSAVTWSEPTTISSAGGYSSQVVIDGSGNAVAVWGQYVGASRVIMAATLPYGGTWSAPQVISGSLGSNGYAPQISINANGYAVVIWSDVTNNYLYSTTYQFGGSWSSPLLVYGETLFYYNYSVAVDGSGNAVVAFIVLNNAVTTVMGATLIHNAGSWTGITPISATYSGNFNVDISMSSSGRAVAIWYGYPSSGSTIVVIQSASYSAGSWTSTDVSITPPTQESAFPVVAVDPNGNAIALWNVGTGIYGVQAATLPFGGSWTTPVTLASSAETNVDINVVVDSSGKGTAIWNVGSTIQRVVATTYSGGSWSTPVTISTVGPNLGTNALTIDSAGDVFAVWSRQETKSYAVRSSTLLHNSSIWAGPSTVETSIEQLSSASIGAFSPNYLIAAWTLTNPVNNNTYIQVSIGSGFPYAVSNLSGVQVLHKFPAQGDLINQLSWSYPSDEGVLKYQIYRNSLSNLIGTTTNFSYLDHDRPPGVYTTYYVVPVDEENNAGISSSIIVAPR